MDLLYDHTEICNFRVLDESLLHQLNLKSYQLYTPFPFVLFPLFFTLFMSLTSLFFLFCYPNPLLLLTKLWFFSLEISLRIQI